MALPAEFYIQVTLFVFQILAAIIYNIYYVAKYAHNEDSDFAKSKVTKAVIIVAYSLPYFMIITVPMDCSLAPYRILYPKVVIALQVFWTMVVFTSVILVWIVIPIMLLFYESDANMAACRRVWSAIKIQLPLFLFMLFMMVPSYFLLNEYSLPEETGQEYGIPAEGK